MNKKQLLDRFEDMTSHGMAHIKENKNEIESFYISDSVVTELVTIIWVMKQVTELTERDMEEVLKRETGLDLNDLQQIENQLENGR